MRRREKRAEVLLLAAVSGEIPADWMGEAAGSKEYGAALLTRLKRDGAVKLRSKDGIRGYLLRAKGKRYLLEMYREDVELFLSGSRATNHIERAGQAAAAPPHEYGVDLFLPDGGWDFYQ